MRQANYSLTKLASDISFFCFTEGEIAKPSAARRALIRTMADYLCKEADVRAYAKDAYNEALRQFVGISDETASACAAQITAKIGEYETSLRSHNARYLFRDGRRLQDHGSQRIRKGF